MKLSKTVSMLFLLATAVLWGGGFIGMRFSLDYMSPLTLVFLRFFFSGLIFLIPAIKDFKKITFKSFAKGALLGVFFSIGFVAQTIGMSMTTTAKSAFITGLNIIFVPFIVWIFSKKRPPLNAFLGVLICLVGLTFISVDFSKGFGDAINTGDMIVLVSALGFAFHIAFTGFFGAKESPSVLMFFMYLVGSVIVFIAMMFNGGFVFEPNLTAFFAIGYCIVFATALTSFLQTVAQVNVRADIAALILAGESVFGAVFSAIFLPNEPITPEILIGCGFMLLGIFLSQFDFKTLKKKR